MSECPICGLRCVYRVNWDTIECPDHGEITGIQLMQYKGLSPRDFWIELQGDRIKWQLRTITERLIERIRTSKPIRVARLHEVCY